MMKEKGKIVNILEVEEDDKERNRGAALLSIYNEFKDEIKAIRTDIQHLNIQQPQQSENNQELNSLLKETIVNAVNDTINEPTLSCLFSLHRVQQVQFYEQLFP